jgi:hypothetical protein
VEETGTIQPKIGSTLFGLLALRQYRTDQAAGIRRVTPRVALLLDCYQATRRREIEAMSPLQWLAFTIKETRAEVAALNERALLSDNIGEVTGILIRVESLTQYVRFLSEKLNG